MKTIILKFNLTGLLILLFFVACTEPLYSQNVGINTTSATPNASAILDLKTGEGAGTLGFLPPNVVLSSILVAAPITTPATGLLVYNTATAGTIPNNVTPGFYYWNGTEWIRVEDNNPNRPYGYNMQYAVGTSDITAPATSNSYQPMTQMSITFTPVHSVVYLYFSASGTTDYSGTSVVNAQFEVLVNGVAPAGVGYGSDAEAQILTTASDQITGWNANLYMPITVPAAGTSVIISIKWTEANSFLGSASQLYNKVSTDPTECHRTMIIND